MGGRTLLLDANPRLNPPAHDARRPNDGSRQTTEQALVFLEHLFTPGPEALGSAKAGQAEEGIGDPALVPVSASYLATDVVQALRLRIR